MRRIASLGIAVPADAEADPPLVSCRIRCCPAMRRIVATFGLTSLIEFVMALALLILLSPPSLFPLPLVEYFRAALKVFNSSLANHKLSHNSNHSVHSLSLSPPPSLSTSKLFSNLQDKLRSFFASVSTFGQLLFVLRRGGGRKA